MLYALAADGRADFDASPVLPGDVTEEERAAYQTELEGMQTRTNGLTYGCYIAGGVGVAVWAVAVAST